MKNIDAVAYDLARMFTGQEIHEARESKRDIWIQEKKQELYKQFLNDPIMCKDALDNMVMDNSELILCKMNDDDPIEFYRVFKQEFQANLLDICEFEAQKQSDNVEFD